MAKLREDFERRYGRLGSGASSLVIDGVEHDLARVLWRLGFGFEGVRIIDAPAAAAGRYAIRFFDFEERRVVCVEFAADMNAVLEETRVHIAEWLGEEYFKMEWEVHCPMDF